MTDLKENITSKLEENDIDVRHIEVNEKEQTVTITLDRDAEDNIKPGQVESVVDLLKTELEVGLDADWLSPNEGTIMFDGRSYFVSVV
jgi:hypothetical protein